MRLRRRPRRRWPGTSGGWTRCFTNWMSSTAGWTGSTTDADREPPSGPSARSPRSGALLVDLILGLGGVVPAVDVLAAGVEEAADGPGDVDGAAGGGPHSLGHDGLLDAEADLRADLVPAGGGFCHPVGVGEDLLDALEVHG